MTIARLNIGGSTENELLFPLVAVDCGIAMMLEMLDSEGVHLPGRADHVEVAFG